VEDTVAELRSIAKGLRPSILDDLGLVASINQMLADAGTRQGFETSFGVNGAERRLSTAAEQPNGGRSASLGLPGMTERAHLIGSRLIIHSEPGVGTTVDVWVPATILEGV
jgi:signal transduction histidine kinase